MAEKRSAIRLPQIACEVTARGVAAVRSEQKYNTIGATHSQALAAGVVTPSLGAQNVQDAHALSEAIGLALTGVGGRGQEVIAVLPDSAVRVTLLDFESLPERRMEADAAVRFRLRKSLPFDIEKAAVSFDAQPTQSTACTWPPPWCCTACWRSTNRRFAMPAARQAWCCLPAWGHWARWWMRKNPPCC